MYCPITQQLESWKELNLSCFASHLLLVKFLEEQAKHVNLQVLKNEFYIINILFFGFNILLFVTYLEFPWITYIKWLSFQFFIL